MKKAAHPAIQDARAALRRRDLPGAYQAALTALRVDACDAEAHAVLGIVLSELNDLPSGEWHLRRALKLDDSLADCLVNLAVNLVRQSRTQEADSYLARADALSPGTLHILAQWSRLQEMQGNLERAEELLDRAAAASSPRDVELLRVLYLRRRGREQEALRILENASDLSGEAQLERGRIYDRLGCHENAWADWQVGNAKLAASAGIEYRPAVIEALFGRLQRFFTRRNLEWLPRATLRRDVPQPLFIMGFPRSGTTLIERVLASHSAVRAGGELTFVGEWPPLIDRLLADSAAFPENLAKTLAANHRHLATLLRDYYFARSEARGLNEPGKRYFTDKMPLNETLAPLVRMAFPNAKIVRVIRHPLDVCVSMFSHELGHGFNCGYRVETIVHQLCASSALVEHYRAELGLGELTLRYEDFVHRPVEETRRLLDYLELPFEPACVNFHQGAPYTATPSYSQVTEPLNDRSIGRYPHYLKQLTPFVPQLSACMAASGYSVESLSTRSPPKSTPQ